MRTLEAIWPKMLLEGEVEVLFEKIVNKHGKKHDIALLRKVYDKLIIKWQKEGKLIVI